MPQHCILSVLSVDKPRIVHRIAEVVEAHKGNWLESRLTQLAGQFAGVIRVSIASDDTSALERALQALAEDGIAVTITPLDSPMQQASQQSAQFTLTGPDRAGIVREITDAFAEYHINVEEIITRCSSMPYSGDPLFEAEGKLQLANDTDWDGLLDKVQTIADQLALDIHVQQSDVG